MKASTPHAISNVEQAAALVEQAQRLTERASQLLSPIRKGAPLWQRLCKLTDQLHMTWSVLDSASRLRHGMSVDSECPNCLADLSGWKTGMPPHRCPHPPAKRQGHPRRTLEGLSEIGNDLAIEAEDD